MKAHRPIENSFLQGISPFMLGVVTTLIGLRTIGGFWGWLIGLLLGLSIVFYVETRI